MTEAELFDIDINEPDRDAERAVKASLDDLSKPIDGFGDFEDVICRIGAVQGTDRPRIDRRAAVIVCADNGIIEEKTSQSPVELTRIIAEAVGKGISTINMLCTSAKADVVAVDVGMVGTEPVEGVLDLKVASGTENFLKAPAMTEQQVLDAIETGIGLAGRLADEGYDIISTGEIGAGNTTTSTAVLCALLGLDSDRVTGRGSGLDAEGFDRKRRVIREGIAKYDMSGSGSDRKRALETLRCLGGLDHACLAGLYIGGAMKDMPVVIDGITTAVAALLAERLVPGTRGYMIPSHRGREGGNELALKALGLRALMDGNMALGEGTGAVLLFPVLDALLYEYYHGARFSDIDMDELERFED